MVLLIIYFFLISPTASTLYDRSTVEVVIRDMAGKKKKASKRTPVNEVETGEAELVTKECFPSDVGNDWTLSRAGGEYIEVLETIREVSGEPVETIPPKLDCLPPAREKEEERQPVPHHSECIVEPLVAKGTSDADTSCACEYNQPVRRYV
jgi:hypothetical protein